MDKDPLEPVQVDSDDAQVQKNLMHTALAFFTGGRTREIHRVKNYDMVCSKERYSYSTTPKFHSSPLKSYHPLEGEDRLPSIIFSGSVLNFQGVPISKRFTLPATNIAPENRQSQKVSSIPTIHFQVLC